MENSLPKAPKHLSRSAKAWWNRIVSEWSLDDASLLVLQVALESFDRMVEAQVRIKQDGGPIIQDRFGVAKSHPGITIEKDSRSAMLSAFKQLHLDLEPIQGIGRPPGG